MQFTPVVYKVPVKQRVKKTYAKQLWNILYPKTAMTQITEQLKGLGSGSQLKIVLCDVIFSAVENSHHTGRIIAFLSLALALALAPAPAPAPLFFIIFDNKIRSKSNFSRKV